MSSTPRLLAVKAGFVIVVCVAGSVQAAQAGGRGRHGHVPAKPAESWVEFTVVRRDSLIALCKQVLVSPKAWREVASFNQLANPDLLLPGQVLRVPSRLVKTLPVDGQIIDIEGEVEATDASGAHAMHTGDSLAEGAQVATSAQGSAVIGLADGSHVRLLPNSLAALSASRVVAGRTARGVPAPASVAANAPSSAPATTPRTWTPAADGWFVGSMRLVRGSMEVLASKIKRAKPLEVETPTTVVGVRGTDYRVGVDAIAEATTGAASGGPAGSAPLPATRVEVLDGRVQVDARIAAQGKKNASALLESGRGAVVDTHGVMQLEPLLVAPDLSGWPALVEVPVIRLDWPHTAPVRVQVARSAAFDDVVFDAKVAAGEPVRVAGLDDGIWQMRVRQISASGIEGYDASRTLELNARPEPPATQAPRPATKLPVGSVLFAWAPNAQATSSRLQVARDPGFAQLIEQRDGLTVDTLSLDVRQPGSYYWRVASANGASDIGPWGVAQRFEARPLPTPPTGRYAEDGALILSWGDIDAASNSQEPLRYAVELSLDESFTALILKSELSVPQWRIKGPGWRTEPGSISKTGTAYFRYRAIEPDGYVSPPSEALKVELPSDPRAPWLLLLPPALLLL